MQNLEEKDLLALLRNQLAQCVGFEGDKLATDRTIAWNYYFQRNRGDEIVGRSNVVSGDLSGMTEAVLSQMDNAFKNTRLVEFEAESAEDQDQCDLESDITCKFVARGSRNNLSLMNAIKTTLLLRNGIVKVYVDDRRDTKAEKYINVKPEAVAEIALNPPPNTEFKITEYNPSKETLAADVTTISRKFCVDAISISNFIYPDDWVETDLQDCPFMAERHVEIRAKLIEQGFPKAKVNRLKRVLGDDKVDRIAQSVGSIGSNRQGLDKSQDLVEWYEAWVLMDAGNGKSKRWRICFGDQVILDKTDDNDLVPYAAGVVFLNPNKFTGISLYDKLKQNQDITTGLYRALFDNVNTVNKNRIAYFDGVVNPDDLSDGRTNNSIRVRPGSVQDVRAAITPFTIPDLSQGLLANINDQRQVRSEMGGAALTLATGELQLGDRAGSQGIDRAYSVMELLTAHMTNNLARTLIRSVYLLAHETLRRNYNYPVSIKQGGRWRTSIPSQWQKRENLEVKPGMSPGERSRRVTMLGQMMANQIALAQQGMDEVLVNLDGFYSTMVDWARAGEIPNPERYYVDPQSPKSKQTQVMKQQQSQQTQKMQQALITQAVALEQMRTAITKYQTDVETQFKYYDANLNAQIEEAKIVGDAAIKLISQKDKPTVEVQNDESGSGNDEGKGAGSNGQSDTE